MRFISGVGIASLALLTGVLATPAEAEQPVAPAPKTQVRAVHEIKVFGRSVKGRELRAYRIGDPTSTRKAVLIGTIHGNEADPAKILLNLMNGPPVTGADIWVIPYLNRDGYAKNRRANAHGVDLNRNFPVSWKKQGGKYYSGRKAASEPETRALMKFLAAVRPAYVVSLHQPLNGVDSSYGKARWLAQRLVAGLKLPKKVFHCRSTCHGTMTQWFNKKLPGAALTVEYGGTVSKRQATVTGPNGLLSSVFASR